MSGNPSMPTASIQYNDDEKLAMARAAAGLLARWNVLGETANRLLDGDERTERAAALLTMHAALRRVFWHHLFFSEHPEKCIKTSEIQGNWPLDGLGSSQQIPGFPNGFAGLLRAHVKTTLRKRPTHGADRKQASGAKAKGQVVQGR
jgi:hypothetical protein